MSNLFNKTLREVIELSASDSPGPGGGSVSAIIACFGLAMTAMVCNLTAGKKKYQDVAPQIDEIRSATNALLHKLEDFVEKDMAVFNAYLFAFRMPKETLAEKDTRDAAMQKALILATETPLSIAETCLEALRITTQLSTIGNKTAVSDAGVAALSIEAALNGVLLSAEINAAMIKDENYVQKIMEKKETLTTTAKQLKDESLLVVRQRMKN